MSSEPEASRRPDRDQLGDDQYEYTAIDEATANTPEGIDTSRVAAQLVDDVQAVHPLGGAVEAIYTGTAGAVAQLPVQNSLVQRRLHGSQEC